MKAIVLSFLIGGACGAGLVALMHQPGVRQNPSPRPKSESRGIPQVSKPSTGINAGKIGSTGHLAELEDSISRDFGPEGPKVADFRVVLERQPCLSRRLAFANLLSQVHASEIPALIDYITELKPKFDLHLEQELAWERFGEVDGAQAAQRIFEMDKRFSETPLSNKVILAWASRDPQAAAAWLMDQPNDPLKHGMIRGMLQGMANADLDGTHQFVDTNLKDPYLRAQGFWRVARRHWEIEGLPGLDRYFQKFPPDHPDYLSTASTVADIYFEAGPQESLDWYQRLSDQERKGFGHQTLQRLSQEKPDNLVIHLSQHGPISGADTDSLLKTAVNTWTKTNPNAMGEWLQKNRSVPHYDLVAKPFVEIIRNQDPEAAAAWEKTLRIP